MYKRQLHGCVRSVLLSGWSGCRAVSAAVRPLCAVGLSGSCQAVTLGPDSDGAPLMSDSAAVRLSDTCCQAVRESAVSAVGLSGAVRRCPGVAVRLSDQGSGVSASEPSGDSAASDERLQRHGDHQEEEEVSSEFERGVNTSFVLSVASRSKKRTKERQGENQNIPRFESRLTKPTRSSGSG